MPAFNQLTFWNPNQIPLHQELLDQNSLLKLLAPKSSPLQNAPVKDLDVEESHHSVSKSERKVQLLLEAYKF